MPFTITLNANGFQLEETHAPKREKGKSLLQVPDDYTVIDLETTGLDPEYDSIIEVCCIKYRNRQEVDKYSTLVKPVPPYDIDFITKLTGITNDMLQNAPRFADIQEDLWNFIRGELLVGHNVNFDVNFLYDNFAKYEKTLQNDFVDTMRLARRVLPELQHHRLTDLSDYFHIEAQHHRAENDCYTTNEVLQHLAEIIAEKHIDLTQSGKNLDLRTVQGDASKNIKDHPFYDKHCVFTGKLERFTRKDAAKLVADIGGHCDNGVTKKTNFLIVGSLEYASNVKGEKSSKLKKAEKLILDGQDLTILTEKVFYDLLEDALSHQN